MEPVWYYVRDGKQIGPISFEELKSAAAAGQFVHADLVWQEGSPDWVAAKTVPGLFASPPPPPPRPVGRSPEPLPLDEGGSGRLAELLPLDSPGGRSAELWALTKEFLRRVSAPHPGAIAPTAEEEDRLTQANITDPVARKYAIWRRAVLWVSVLPTGFAAFFGFINAFAIETDNLTALGLLVVAFEALVFLVLPASAVMGALAYDRPRASARWVMLGALISIGFPLVVAFIPAHWFVAGRMDDDARTGFGFFFGIVLYLTLMPTVLSLLPAVSRACVRVKGFLPQSLVPGWGLVASAPLFVLLTLATFVLLYQVARGNVLLVAGLLLWIGVPLFYLTKFRLLTRPVTHRRDLDALAKTQVGVLAMIAGGITLIIIFLFTATIGGMSLMGTSSSSSLMQPWSLDVHKKWIEYVGRSLFMTVLFADLIMRMSLSVWREECAFASSEHAAAFDRTMTSLTESIGPKRDA